MPAAPQEVAPQVSKKKSSTLKKLLIILLIILLLAGLGAGGYFYYKSTNNKDKLTGPDPNSLVSLSMGSLLVNLADPGGANFMRLTPVLEYEDSKQNKNLAEELSKKKYVLQDTIIRVIRTKNLADVQPPQSIDKMAAELKQKINQDLHEGQIYRVYFTEYLTQ